MKFEINRMKNAPSRSINMNNGFSVKKLFKVCFLTKVDHLLLSLFLYEQGDKYLGTDRVNIPFWDFQSFILHDLESCNFLRRCEYLHNYKQRLFLNFSNNFLQDSIEAFFRNTGYIVGLLIFYIISQAKLEKKDKV